MNQFHHIAHVPAHIADCPIAMAAHKRWKRLYNVAAWFFFEYPDGQALSMHIRYRDAKKVVHTVEVDRTIVRDNIILLCGVVGLNLTGPFSDMEAVLESPDRAYRVVEVFVQKVERDSRQRRMRQAS